MVRVLIRIATIFLAFAAHTASASEAPDRYRENDQTPQDNNAEDGNAWTLAYFYDFSDKLSFGAESLSINTDRFSWQYYGLDPTRTEKQLQVTAQLRFGN